MKRALILTILLITLLFAPFGVISARTPVLTLEDTVVEYSPDGYMQGYGMESDQRARNSIILRPFDSYGVIVQDSTEVRIDSVNFIGPLIKK